MQKTVHYGDLTEFTSQYHVDSQVNTIDASHVNDEDYVICWGSYDDKGSGC